jgi:hypothetical protein
VLGLVSKEIYKTSLNHKRQDSVIVMISKRLKAKGLRPEENVEMWKCTSEQIKSKKQSWATVNLQQLRLKPF